MGMFKLTFGVKYNYYFENIKSESDMDSFLL